MTKEDFDILLSFILLGIFLFGGIYLFKTTKRDWNEESLKVRNYMFVFCSFLNFGLVIFLGILIYLRLMQVFVNASLEVDATRVSLGMYVTKNPERTMDQEYLFVRKNNNRNAKKRTSYKK